MVTLIIAFDSHCKTAVTNKLRILFDLEIYRSMVLEYGGSWNKIRGQNWSERTRMVNCLLEMVDMASVPIGLCSAATSLCFTCFNNIISTDASRIGTKIDIPCILLTHVMPLKRK